MKLDTKVLKTITLLYVEDDDMIRDQSVKLYEKLFKEVYIGVDGTDGLEKYKLHHAEIDIIVTDINMPNMNGIDMLININKLDFTSVPAIITTAHSDSENLIQAIDNNVDSYITKPIRLKELTLNIVSLVLKYRRSNNLEILARGLVQDKNKNTQINSKLIQDNNRLKKENEYYKMIVDSFVISCRTDKFGEILEVSTRFCSLFDYNNNDIIGKNINILKCDSCNEDGFQKLMLKVIHSKQTIASQHTFSTSNDRKIVCDITMTPTYDCDSLVSGYIFYLEIL